MGGKISKNKLVDSSSMEDGNPRYQSDPTSNRAARRVDPSLQDLDKTLHDRADHVIRTLAAGAKAQSLTMDDLVEVTTDLRGMHLASANIIRTVNKDIKNDKELSDLVDCYFKQGKQILDFYSSLRQCLSQARDNCLSIEHLLMHSEEERGENVGSEKYLKTSQELQKFKEASNLFMEELSKLFHLVYKQQKEMWQKLQDFEKKLDKKLKSTKVWKSVTKAIFLTAFVATLVFSVVAVAINAPPFVTALTAALAAPIGTVGKTCDTWWKNCLAKLEKKKELIDMMNMKTTMSIAGLEMIRLLLSQLETKIQSISQNANSTLGEEQEEVVKAVMSEIQTSVEDFKEDIENLSTEANESRRHIELAMNMISQSLG